ncbi:MAG: alkaline phosphatase [Vulcanimicrobiota bacterium]
MKQNPTIKKTIILLILILALSLVFNQCASAQKQDKAETASDSKPEIKNVIVFIGDGAGSQQRRLAALVEGNGDPEHRLHMEKMTTSGLAFNHSLDKLVTDSAASGTALATGFKTKNYCISMLPDGTKLKTILEMCKERGMGTGLVTTVPMAHATPAAFGAHVKSRKMMDEIADQFLKTEIDVLMGGGREDFLPTRETIKPHPEVSKVDSLTHATYEIETWTGKRKDGRNLIREFQKKGYFFAPDARVLRQLVPGDTRKIIALFCKGAMAYEIDRPVNRQPSIAEMTEKSIQVLRKNPNGFFLMVEGGKIDWANHGHDVAGSVYDTIALDKAVKIALDFQKKHPDTLVLVVNDHETGGMAITANINIPRIKKLEASADRMANLINRDGSNVDEVFKQYAGITDLKPRERQMVIDEATGKLNVADEWGYGGTVIANILDIYTGVHFSTGGHSGTPVVVAVQGPGSCEFDGFYDQTEIPRKIARLLGFEMPEKK